MAASGRRWPLLAAWAALFAAAGLTSWLLLHSHTLPRAGSTGVPRAEQPDYLLHQTTITRFALNGDRRYVIHAQQIAHLPSEDVALLQTINLDYFPAAGTPWHLKADHGRLEAHETRLKLDGNVHAREIGVTSPIEFSTSVLTMLLPSERVQTDARVVLHQGHRETRGTGLAANLQTGTLSLLKDVTSRYVP